MIELFEAPPPIDTDVWLDDVAIHIAQHGEAGIGYLLNVLAGHDSERQRSSIMALSHSTGAAQYERIVQAHGWLCT
ncbi:MAG: hypothetical protein HC914_13835 [Chloroflexaceae bacterium]|nr:hypothetical protein [Chloroflexaceae bacterium]